MPLIINATKSDFERKIQALIRVANDRSMSSSNFQLNVIADRLADLLEQVRNGSEEDAHSPPPIDGESRMRAP